MNEQNLIPNSQRSPSELREQTRKGGIASGRARLAKKHGRELVQALLAAKEMDPAVLAEVAKSFGLDPKQVTKDVAMHIRQIDKAIRKADTKAYLAVSKVSGALEEKEDKSTTINVTISAEAAAAGAKWSKP